ncbi:hypothetical protein GCM10009549_31270 [Streptomyces thermoalcalitolerans]|uniref:Uncharacterized protein n=2 Tax=Streptomyces thermoalcalitolerans TaxID=65605 RepID=A0ABP3Z5J9_9ACTN
MRMRRSSSRALRTLPPALAGTGVRVTVCDIGPSRLIAHASPRAQGFLSGVTGTARGVLRLARTAHAG